MFLALTVCLRASARSAPHIKTDLIQSCPHLSQAEMLVSLAVLHSLSSIGFSQSQVSTMAVDCWHLKCIASISEGQVLVLVNI